ncbi:MAG: hypothetical protein EA402_05600 [Planctomycetota bacterium]|nr:MAG: hypothetical protein EA402_05600 [Planctomycetota bacterium]
MKRHACLIAGPFCLDQLPESPDTLGGSGFYAAAAAAPFALSQLWSRVGALDNSLRRVITARHIDEAGMDYAGPLRRWQPGQAVDDPDANSLGSLTPESAEDLTCALAIDLPGPEMERALAALAELDDSVGRTLLIAPRRQHLDAQPGLLERCCQRAGVLILDLQDACALTAHKDPLLAIRSLQELGAKSVVLRAGVLGGLCAYQQKIYTWPSYPVMVKEPTGMSAAFAGALCGALAEAGKCDWRSLKRSLALASAVASLCAQGIGPKRLLASNRSDYTDRFNRLRRNAKA